MNCRVDEDNMNKYNVIIADDHPVFRKGLREIIDAIEYWQVIAEAESGATALKYYQQYQPDVIVLDISMGKMSGLEVAEKILAQNKNAKCVIMTMYKEVAYCHRAMSLGVKGYLLKDDASDDIKRCLEDVVQNKKFVSETLSKLIKSLPPNAEAMRPESILTKRELCILKSIANLKTNKEIAKEFNISTRTVQNHRQNMSEKLHLSGRQALLQFAVKWEKRDFL